MGMKYKEKGFNYNVVPRKELRLNNCAGCIHEKYNITRDSGTLCELSNYLVMKYNFSCNINKAILIADPLLILKKL